MNEAIGNTPTAGPDLQRRILTTIARKTFCTVATTSTAGWGHSAGVVYDAVEGALWFHASRASRKVRNIESNPKVGVCIPYRRLPVGPPFAVHFQAKAEVIAMDHADVARLLGAGRLQDISAHGALDMPDGCFVQLSPHGSVHSFGPGARTMDLIRNPLETGARTFRPSTAEIQDVLR